ncbi:hypothetical protein D3C71_1738840 [compost metagenome]
MLFHGHRGRFAGGTDHADAIGALGNVPVDQFSQATVIHAAIGLHGSDQGNNTTGQRNAGGCHGNVYARGGKRDSSECRTAFARAVYRPQEDFLTQCIEN